MKSPFINPNMDVFSPANMSVCGQYRYSLYREVDPAKQDVYAFFGVNPSDADHQEDDPTIRKMQGFVSRWGGRGFVVGNVFAYRHKDVAQLSHVSDPFGVENKAYVSAILSAVDVIVPCWGERKKVSSIHYPMLDAFMENLMQQEKSVKILGITQTGDPLHPLMPANSTPLLRLK